MSKSAGRSVRAPYGAGRLRLAAVGLIVAGGALAGGAAWAGTSSGVGKVVGYGSSNGCTATLTVAPPSASVTLSGTCHGTLLAYQLDNPPALWPQTLTSSGATQVTLPDCAWQVDYALGPVVTTLTSYQQSLTEDPLVYATGGSGSCSPPATTTTTAPSTTTTAPSTTSTPPTTASGGGGLGSTTTSTTTPSTTASSTTTSSTTTPSTAPASSTTIVPVQTGGSAPLDAGTTTTVAGTGAATGTTTTLFEEPGTAAFDGTTPVVSSGALAFTGPPSGTPYLIGAGIASMALGGVALRLSGRRAGS